MITSKFRNTMIVRNDSEQRLIRPLIPIQLEWLETLGLKPDIFTSQSRAG